MKSTGIVRKVDELGRIVLPIELRRTLDIAERDERDMNREIAPLKQAEDAVFLDTSDIGIEEVKNTIIDLIRSKQ